MAWTEAHGADDKVRRVLTARAGPYALTVVEALDGTVTWSVGEGAAGETNELEGVAGDVAAGQRAAVMQARRRWAIADEAIGELERGID